MTWTLEYSDELDIVVLTYKGKTTGFDLKEASTARIALGREKGVSKYLIDTTEVEVSSSATSDVLDLPDKVYSDKQVDYSSRIAIIEPKSAESRKMVKFYEDACVNRGWLVKMFKDRPSALGWLEIQSF